METKSMIGLIIGFLVGAILLASFVPIFVNVQNESGEEITLVNESSFVLKEVDSGDVLKNVRTTVDGTHTDAWTLNDITIVGPSSGGTDWTVGIMSDSVYMQINAPDNASAGSWLYMDGTSTYHYFGNITVTFTTTQIEIVTGSDATSAVIDYSWAYVICPYEDGEYIAPSLGGTGYVSQATDVLLCGYYSTGELDTMYYYHDGNSYVSTDGYSMSANIDLVLHSGTSDIYDATVSVTVTDDTDSETFTPYRIFVPYEVTGHATKGVMFDIFGLLPLIAGVGLLMGAVVYFLRRY